MTISALFATISLVLVRAGWMRVVSASCLVSATCLLFSLSTYRTLYLYAPVSFPLYTTIAVIVGNAVSLSPPLSSFLSRSTSLSLTVAVSGPEWRTDRPTH